MIDLNNPNFFIGVVEDRNDPLKLGRVRVRVVGIHSDDKNAIPTDALPWAMPLQPITSAAMNGIGESPTGMVEGTWVAGYARDGDAYQDLLIIGTTGGIPSKEAQTTGFNDPNKKYPLSDHINEPDTNRLARNENIENTIVPTKKSDVDKGVETPIGSWDEPETPYNAQYPMNHVRESESGHIHEIDDTPGAERLHQFHMSGTFTETHPDGTKVTKVVGEDYEIFIKNRNVHVKGNVNITVDGNSNIYTKGNVEHKVDGNLHEEIAGNVTREVGGDVTEVVSGSVSETVSGDQSENISGNMSSDVGGDDSANIAGSHTTDVGASLTETVSASTSRTASAHAISGPVAQSGGDLSVADSVAVAANLAATNISASGEVDAGPAGTKLSTHIHPGINVPPTPGT